MPLCLGSRAQRAPSLPHRTQSVCSSQAGMQVFLLECSGAWQNCTMRRPSHPAEKLIFFPAGSGCASVVTEKAAGCVPPAQAGQQSDVLVAAQKWAIPVKAGGGLIGTTSGPPSSDPKRCPPSRIGSRSHPAGFDATLTARLKRPLCHEPACSLCISGDMPRV